VHFGLQDGPEIVTSNSLPFVFDRYSLQGTITEAELDAAVAGAEPAPVPLEPAFQQTAGVAGAASTGPVPASVSLGGPAGPQVTTHPLYLTVIAFPWGAAAP
jgi:hypothetical protein